MNGTMRSCFHVLVGIWAALPSGPAFAEGEEHHGGGGHDGIDPKTFALQLLNFGVLLFILMKFGGSAINAALKKRHETLKADLLESQRLRAAAEARLAEQEQRLTNLAGEIAELRARMKKDAEAERERMIAAAEDKAGRVRRETEFLLAQQVRQAELGFKAEMAAAAVRIATELVRTSVGPEDQRRLIDSFVGDIDAGEKARVS